MSSVAIPRNARDNSTNIPDSYKPRKKFMELAIAEAKRAADRGDYPIGAVITRVVGKREVVIASAGNRVKTSGSSIKHVELETLKYVSSGYGRYLQEFALYSTHEPCAMCAGACACGLESARWYTASLRKTLPLTAASTARNTTSGERALFPVSSFLRRAITAPQSSAASCERNAKNFSVTKLR